MTVAQVVRWWPLVGVVAMVLLGLAVGDGSTRLDDWFTRTGEEHRFLGRLLVFTAPPVLAVLLLGAVMVALYRRRWRLAFVVLLTPAVAVLAVRVLKPLIGREREGALAYPSGHVTVMTVVLGMFVLVVGARWWQIIVATAFAVLGILGQSFTYHYFTDTIGAAFLGTALVCAAARTTKIDRCQPRCDPDHSER